jgi:DNA repair exonuclease SbcCD ATPase subunit
MLLFQSISYKNFLVAGNAPITIDLSKHTTTLIIGKNGVGKSTLAEAICFACFGRPLRNVNKPQLVNSVNGRDCFVELSFVAQGVPYRIRRGIKPNVFEIYENSNLIPAPAAINDYQAMLETHILKLNFKSFSQVVILGGSTYIPFMRLTASSRRQVIEDLLDIEVFSSMNALAKEDGQENKNDLDKTQQARHLVQEQVKMAQQFTDAMKEHQEQAVANVGIAIQNLRIEMDEQQQVIDDLDDKLLTYAEVENAYNAANGKVREYQLTLSGLETRHKKLVKDHSFYCGNDTCPTCEQTIDSVFKRVKVRTLLEKEAEALKAIAECKKLVEKYNQRASELTDQLHDAADLRRQHDKLSAKMPIHAKRMKELEAELVAHQTPKQAVDVDVEALEQQLAELRTRHEALSKRRVLIDAASMLLRDNGIKTRVIRHYLPIINRTINHYLTQMDFPISFNLDEEFVEHIKSRHRDEYSYESFSDGEKKRIDLALLFTWRTVAALKNSAATNLLILDEVFDSSLDLGGTEEFMKIIAALGVETNVFIISHKSDQMVDKFSHVIAFEKARGFSQVRQ